MRAGVCPSVCLSCGLSLLLLTVRVYADDGEFPSRKVEVKAYSIK